MNRLRVEYDSVVQHGHGCHSCENPDQVRFFRRAESEEVEIAGGSVGFLVPNDKQHRALEQEPVGMGRLTQPEEEALDTITQEQEVEVFATDRGHVLQTGFHRGGDVLGSVHASISMYG